MGGQRMEIGGFVWWHGESVGGVTKWHGRRKHGSSGGAYFGHGRCENGVKWWDNDAKTTSNKAH
jgi:hypothetical protein